MGSLAIWLDGRRIAAIDQHRGRLALVYADAAFEAYPLGAPVLSLTLPLTAERFGHGVVRPFLDGLLPEGSQRIAIALDLGLVPEDTYGLIRALGRDCAGALVIQPDDHDAPPAATTITAEPLDDAGIAKLVANLRIAPLGIDDRVRMSLAGVQEKLLLTRLPTGGWGRPIDGTPSTHILKPEAPAYPGAVANEAFCMRVARHLGLMVPAVETTEIGGRRLIVVERYDRIVSSDGAVRRVHQEDFCQALGVRPERKYQEDGGPSLARMARTLLDVARPGDLQALLAAVTLNVVIGNGDAHGKNFALLHDLIGSPRLAPLYDLLCTLHYGDDRLAMCVDDVRRTSRVTAERLVNEVAGWGIRRPEAEGLVADLVDRVPAAVEAARDETPGLDDGVLAVVEQQAANLRQG